MEFGDDVWFKQDINQDSPLVKNIKKGCIVLFFLIISYYLFNKYIRYSKAYYRFLAYINKFQNRGRKNSKLNNGTYFPNDEFYPTSQINGTKAQPGNKYFIMFTGEGCPISNEKKTYIYGKNETADKIRELFKKEKIKLIPYFEANTYGESKYEKGTGAYFANVFEKKNKYQN